MAFDLTQIIGADDGYAYITLKLAGLVPYVTRKDTTNFPAPGAGFKGTLVLLTVDTGKITSAVFK
jgi:hypothetical protein